MRNSAQSAVVVDDLTKHFRRRDGRVVPAIDGADLEVARGEFVVLLGPSGCGKTTLLRSVAGLETPDAGRITVQGRTVFDAAERVWVGPERRDLSMMFQSYALWPHMTVARNVRYPLENRREGRLRRADMDAKVRDTLASVGIGELAEQYPAQLSGGQQQRVALARALVNDSDLVLFDEPLSNVDAKVREQLRIELLGTQRRLGFTALFVTHDQSEAMELATRIAVLDDGVVRQIGTPEEVYSRPATEYVARFIGNTNELTGSRQDGGYSTELGLLRVADGSPTPESANLLWRPEAARLERERPSDTQSFEATVLARLFMGTHTEYLVRAGDVRARIWTHGHERHEPEDVVWVCLRPEDLMVFDAVPTTASAAAAVSGAPAEVAV